MRISVQCKQCSHAWELFDEPRQLHPLTCEKCDTQALGRATEDLSSAVEDALAQLWQVSQNFDVDVAFSTRQVPATFKPPQG